MTAPTDPKNLGEQHVESPRDPEFRADRYSVPLAIVPPNIIGFSSCEIAPGLEIRRAAQADNDRLGELNKTWASMLAMAHVAPLRHSSYFICIDQQLYGHHVEQKIMAIGKKTDPNFKTIGNVGGIYKMIVTAMHLFKPFQLVPTQ
jgi:hypothetical protein